MTTRITLAALMIIVAAPALASPMHQSPLLGHAAGAACVPGHPRGPAGPGPRIAGCLRRTR